MKISKKPKRDPMLNYRQLYYFFTVAKTGGIVRASEQLHLTPQTLSGQVSQLEANLGVDLFHRQGRRLVLTDQGRQVLSYANEIFQIGQELEECLSRKRGEPQLLFRIGVADVMPKAIAYELLSPSLNMPESIRLTCREDKFERLLAELALHKLDLVLVDRPIPAGFDIKGYSHRLGECGVSFMVAPSLRQSLSGPFPQMLHGAPFLIPGEDSAIRGPLLRWLRGQDIYPQVVCEFDDGALMKAFGRGGAGVFPVPAPLAEDIAAQYGVMSVGETNAIKEKFYLITVERKLVHPAARAISEAAHKVLFA